MEDQSKNTNHKNVWIIGLIAGLLLYAVLFFGTLFSKLGHVRNMVIGDSVDIALGPIKLLHIHKAVGAAGSRFSVDFSFKSGLVLLFIVCMVLALLGAWLANRQHKS